MEDAAQTRDPPVQEAGDLRHAVLDSQDLRMEQHAPETRRRLDLVAGMTRLARLHRAGADTADTEREWEQRRQEALGAAREKQRAWQQQEIEIFDEDEEDFDTVFDTSHHDEL